MDGQTDRVIPKYKTTTLFAGERGEGVYIESDIIMTSSISNFIYN